MLSIIANKVRKAISCEIAEAGMFSLMCDEVSDIANGEWITVVIRFVRASEIKECLLDIVPICDLHASALCDTVTTTLLANNVNLAMTVVQCYDGASNKSGQYGGLQAKFKELVGAGMPFIFIVMHTS